MYTTVQRPSSVLFSDHADEPSIPSFILDTDPELEDAHNKIMGEDTG